MNTYEVTLNGKPYAIKVTDLSGDVAKVEVNGKSFSISIDNIRKGTKAPAAPRHSSKKAAAPAPAAKPAVAAAGSGALTAPIPGSIMELFVKEGDTVKAGQPVLKMEAMKMENEIKAATDGNVTAISVSAGDSVVQGQELMVIG